MQEQGYCGTDMGQFKNDTGGPNSRVIAGVFGARKSYFLMVFDGTKFVFKTRMKGVSTILKNNPPLIAYKNHASWVSRKMNHDFKKGLGFITTTTTRKPLTGVVFKEIRKYMRRGLCRTRTNIHDDNICIPFN